MVVTTPERSLEQRREGLEKANTIRFQRALLKKQLKSGEVSIFTLLENPPDFIIMMKLSKLLLSVPKYGDVKVNKILIQCVISPSKTVGGLSPRQKASLVMLLRR
jgi:hypothetical protein